MMLLLMLLLFTLCDIATAGSVSVEDLTLNLDLDRRGIALSTEPPVDQSLLAIQIGGIVGAYVIFVAILLTLLLFVGRRLRRAVQASNYTLQVEMMKPSKQAVSMDPSPVTPVSARLPSPIAQNGFNRSWGSLAKGPRPHVSGNGSAATIDESVVAIDRQRAQEELEMLYAAVMEHDAQRAAGIDTSKQEWEVQSPGSVHTNPFTDRSSRTSERPSISQTKLPLSPKSSRLSRISSLSLFNSNSQSKGGKIRSPRLPLRNLAISSPVGSPDLTAPHSYGEDQMPLTPRLYNPAPPPAPPITISQASSEVSLGKAPGRAPAPAPLSLSTASHGSSSLPFRDAFPLQSAPPTKTTVIERPIKPLNGPRTGLPTPYSPYMPFTPVTPLTPSRIVTKRQRKRETKENGLRVLNEDDIVKDDVDMWGY
ncbi:hypothetical protein LV164_000746 [Aspergillus fumigatus]|nr:hypothetical protein KXX42_002750 [Aspergillus fumigatus]KAH2316434.1 hypothetical protein KXV47_001124 [Aspergillus fumigatus]KAH2750772.1 hypothetical protein KXV94_002785 [Aspergillus fumigatus]KAH3146632.1 hypothetical protein KXW18_006452 [Aspergillus fumigatus]KAH3191352.1 hypothetical protein KXV92_002898 [Aspergillus fumigatus]